MSEKSAKLRKVTGALLASFALILLFWDVAVAFNDVRDDTISELLRDLSHRWYTLPYIMGVIMGHLFWNRAASEMYEQKAHLLRFFIAVGGTTVIFLARDIVGLFFVLPSWPQANLVLVVTGFLVGAVWWPQKLPEKEQIEA